MHYIVITFNNCEAQKSLSDIKIKFLYYILPLFINIQRALVIVNNI